MSDGTTPNGSEGPHRSAGPAPGGVPAHEDAELGHEQAYIDAAYARIDAMRIAAESVRNAYADVQSGGTHQARLERDIAYDVTERRLAELDIGDNPLVFGRLDLDSRDDSDPERLTRYYVGRIAVDDEAHTPLVVDWRAPVSEPFYRATAVEPMHVVRRRHFITRAGREVLGIDDEVFDQAASEAAGLTVAGEGALLRALERDRTGRMGDIVATIQAEQDVAIRADLAGVLVVTGGPGTGKTAVALHRAAYLLYTHRRRLAASGVLLIGPGPMFLRYIEHVLPSLGEQDVQIATIAGLKPQLPATTAERPEVAAIKGDARMRAVIAKAVADRQRPLRDDLLIVIDGLALRITRQDTVKIVQGARRQKQSHNARRPGVARRLTELLVARYKRAASKAYRDQQLDTASAGGGPATVASLDDWRRRREEPTFDARGGDRPDVLIGRALARGEALPEGWERELAARLRRRPEVRDALQRMWPVLSGAELVNDLLGFRALVRSAAGDALRDDEQELLHRAHVADPRAARWTDADVPLVDEADALLGPVEAARPRRSRRRGPDQESIEAAERVVEELGLGRFTTAEGLAARFAETGGDDSEPGDLRTFGHVLVDEAQDLTAMQWRMLARRCPSGSMTLVGDPAQASRPGSLARWDDILAHLPTLGDARYAALSVNYRTPAEIMAVANRVLAAAAPGIAPSRSVRATGEQPRFVAVGEAERVGQTGALTRAARARGGTIAVIAPRALHAALVAELADVGAASGSADAIDAPVAVLDATEAKGLEFDHVVTVEPADLVTPDAAGLRLLYVTITRATKTLAVVHARPLPDSLRLD